MDAESDAAFWVELLKDGRPFDEIVQSPGIYFERTGGDESSLPTPPPGYAWMAETGGLIGASFGSLRLWPTGGYGPGAE